MVHGCLGFDMSRMNVQEEIIELKVFVVNKNRDEKEY